MKNKFTWYSKAKSDYKKHLALTDDVLYELCKRYPNHSKKSDIHAKLCLIGRSYNTGIERQIKSRGGQGSALTQLAAHLYNNRKKVDKMFKQLSSVAEPLTVDKLEVIVETHGRFVNLLAKKLRKKRSARSFASKYMHFHCPAVPIYDSIATSVLRSKCRWKDSFEIFNPPKNSDEEYCYFTFRFWQLYLALRKIDKGGNVKLLDNYLIWIS